MLLLLPFLYLHFRNLLLVRHRPSSLFFPVFPCLNQIPTLPLNRFSLIKSFNLDFTPNSKMKKLIQHILGLELVQYYPKPTADQHKEPLTACSFTKRFASVLVNDSLIHIG